MSTHSIPTYEAVRAAFRIEDLAAELSGNLRTSKV